MIFFMKATFERQNERGSVLIMIFIGVALFGALSFTVSQIMRSGNPDAMGDEKTKLLAVELVGYARSIRNAVQNQKISNGCDDTEINFHPNVPGSIVRGTGENPYRDDCNVFDPDNGGIPYIPFPSYASESNPATLEYGWWFRTMRLGQVGVHGNPDLTLEIRNVSNPLCKAINTALGHDFGDTIPVDTTWGNGGHQYSGTYSTCCANQISGPDIDGKTAFCHKDRAATVTDANPNYFYYTLIAR